MLTEQEEKEKILPTEDKMNIQEVLHELPGIPIIRSNNPTKSGIIFIFERASLVPALVGKTYQILNPDDHANFLRRHKKNPYDYRPEIIHQALLEVADSKLYKTGRVQAIYVKTDEGLLIKIEPHMLIPKTYRRFCAMMLELLQKFSVKAMGKREKLLRLIANPVTQHLPTNCYKIGLSYSSEKRVRLKDYVGDLNDDVNLVFVVGAMAHGKINCEYTDDVVSVSEFPLSAACCVRRISCAMEKKWKIL
ncbi:Ribosomal rna small subunit methyltransferase nep1 [Thalictrum thalictroides]|uniref:Ribosomal rna small subunit methyltransferase nep1 n=1 Tax=Thalictrum thalictroides TaxID=46969 RepID=A0A7J6W2V9_THATH|nr:Ribosomal rna small subunit methyltransferase nep1 [Thalictrum thalictroides]